MNCPTSKKHQVKVASGVVNVKKQKVKLTSEPPNIEKHQVKLTSELTDVEKTIGKIDKCQETLGKIAIRTAQYQKNTR